MSNDNELSIEFVQDEKSQWRAADLLPREACIVGRDLYIKLGVGPGNEVELHTMDERRMARGDLGSYQKKHFFFHVNTCGIVALPGDTQIVPRRVNIQVLEIVTFTPRETIPFAGLIHNRDTQEISLDTFADDAPKTDRRIERENWNQEVTDAD